MVGGIRTFSGISIDPTFLWISSNFRPMNLLLVRSHQAEVIIAKRLIQRRNNVIKVEVESRSCDQGRRKNDAFTHSASLLTINSMQENSQYFLLINQKKILSQNILNYLWYVSFAPPCTYRLYTDKTGQ